MGMQYIFRQKFYDCLHNANLMQEIEDELTDALIQADFMDSIDIDTDIEMRFSDLTMYKNAIRMFSLICERLGYIYRFNRENEIVVHGDCVRVSRYIFMNSIPDSTPETVQA